MKRRIPEQKTAAGICAHDDLEAVKCLRWRHNLHKKCFILSLRMVYHPTHQKKSFFLTFTCIYEENSIPGWVLYEFRPSRYMYKVIIFNKAQEKLHQKREFLFYFPKRDIYLFIYCYGFNKFISYKSKKSCSHKVFIYRNVHSLHTNT